MKSPNIWTLFLPHKQVFCTKTRILLAVYCTKTRILKLSLKKSCCLISIYFSVHSQFFFRILAFHFPNSYSSFSEHLRLERALFEAQVFGDSIAKEAYFNFNKASVGFQKLLRGCCWRYIGDVVGITSRMQLQRHRGYSFNDIEDIVFVTTRIRFRLKWREKGCDFIIKYVNTFDARFKNLLFYKESLRYYGNIWQIMTILRELQQPGMPINTGDSSCLWQYGNSFRKKYYSCKRFHSFSSCSATMSLPLMS